MQLTGVAGEVLRRRKRRRRQQWTSTCTFAACRRPRKLRLDVTGKASVHGELQTAGAQARPRIGRSRSARPCPSLFIAAINNPIHLLSRLVPIGSNQPRRCSKQGFATASPQRPDRSGDAPCRASLLPCLLPVMECRCHPVHRRAAGLHLVSSPAPPPR